MKVAAVTVRSQARSPRLPTTEEIELLLQQRERCRFKKDFGGADRIRAELLRRGVEIRDNPKHHGAEHFWKARNGREGPLPKFDELPEEEEMITTTAE